MACLFVERISSIGAIICSKSNKPDVVHAIMLVREVNYLFLAFYCLFWGLFLSFLVYQVPWDGKLVAYLLSAGPCLSGGYIQDVQDFFLQERIRNGRTPLRAYPNNLIW